MQTNLSVRQWHRRFIYQTQWTAEVRDYLFHRASLETGDSIIEVGCGTGAVLSQLPENLYRWGLDINTDFLAHAAALTPSAKLTCGDAHRLPLASGSFDAACCHFLLLWVGDPLKTLTEMARICKPGGTVFVLAEPDYGGRVDHPEEMAVLGDAQTESLRVQGADPLIGRRLAELMSAAGLIDIEIGIISSRWRPPLSPEALENEWETLEHDLADRISPQDLNSIREIDRAAWADGSRVLFVPTFYAYGEIATK